MGIANVGVANVGERRARARYLEAVAYKNLVDAELDYRDYLTDSAVQYLTLAVASFEKSKNVFHKLDFWRHVKRVILRLQPLFLAIFSS